MDIRVLITRILLLFLMILPGFVLRKRWMLSAEASKGMSNLVLYVAQPALIVASFLRPFDMEILKNALGVFVFAFLTNGFGCAAVLLLFKKAPERRRQVLRFSVAFANVLFMGLPVVTGVFGPDAAIYASVYTLWFNIFVWSVGAMFYTGDKSYISAKHMFLNPSSLAAFAGILLFVTGAQPYVPQVICDGLDMLGGVVAPLSMIVIGIRFAEVDLKSIFNDKYMYIFSAYRLIGGPVAAFVFLKLAELLFGYHNEMVTFIIIVLCSTPTASITGMFAEKFNADAAYASKCVSVNTVFSLITMPLMALLAMV